MGGAFAPFGVGCLAALVASISVPTDARAENWPIGRSLSVDVVGRISPTCRLETSSTSGDFGDILDRSTGTSAGGTLVLPFNLDCNSPARITLQSRNGGLRVEGVRTADPDFAQIVTYEARARLGRRAGEACASESMRADTGGVACRSLFEAAGRKAGEVELNLQPGGRPLLNGRYTDTLVMQVSPMLGDSGARAQE